MARLRAEPSPAGTLFAAERALRAVRGQAERDTRDVRAAAADVEAHQRRFHAAQQERKSLERLRHKRHTEWVSEMRLSEQAEIDEVAARMRRSSSKG